MASSSITCARSCCWHGDKCFRDVNVHLQKEWLSERDVNNDVESLSNFNKLVGETAQNMSRQSRSSSNKWSCKYNFRSFAAQVFLSTIFSFFRSPFFSFFLCIEDYFALAQISFSFSVYRSNIYALWLNWLLLGSSVGIPSSSELGVITIHQWIYM